MAQVDLERMAQAQHVAREELGTCLAFRACVPISVEAAAVVPTTLRAWQRKVAMVVEVMVGCLVERTQEPMARTVTAAEAAVDQRTALVAERAVMAVGERS